jgi:hypothetical protein
MPRVNFLNSSPNVKFLKETAVQIFLAEQQTPARHQQG